MKPKVYIETTIISYLVARPSRDLIVAGHQQITHEWWQTPRHNFAAVSSQLVVREAGAGDIEAAEARLAFLAGLTLLEISDHLHARRTDGGLSDVGRSDCGRGATGARGTCRAVQ